MSAEIFMKSMPRRFRTSDPNNAGAAFKCLSPEQLMMAIEHIDFNAEWQFENGDTLLHFLVRRDIEHVRAATGAAFYLSSNKKNNFGFSPFHIAFLDQKVELCRVLIETFGASVDQPLPATPEYQGMTPRQYAQLHKLVEIQALFGENRIDAPLYVPPMTWRRWITSFFWNPEPAGQLRLEGLPNRRLGWGEWLASFIWTPRDAIGGGGPPARNRGWFWWIPSLTWFRG